MMVIGTKNADVLDINFGDTVTALGGADTINVNQGEPYDFQATNPYGVIDGGSGVDTLVLNSAQTEDLTYWFSDLRSIEKLKFTNTLGSYDAVQLSAKVPVSATGTVAAGAPLAILGSTGGNEVLITVTGGMGSASTITMPKLSFIGFDPSAQLATVFGDDFVQLSAGDSANYVLQASEAIGRLGIEQDIVGNAGDDTLIGSSGSDWLSGHAGADKMYGKGGDDGFALFGSDKPDAGDLFDGGSGNDFLFINGRLGPVTFAGTLVSIEGIRMGFKASLSITADQMTMLPAALRVSGAGTGTINITDANHFSAAKFTFLGATAPKITITGTAGADILTGSSGDDVLHGAGGADRLNGGAGQDTLYGDAGGDKLTGGLGADTFVFDSVAKPVARDTITDFSSADGDHIALTLAGFAGIHQAAGPLDAAEFYAAAGAKAAHNADDRIIYDTTTGTLAYDADGLGGQAPVVFAVLTGHPALAAADIMVI